MPSGAQRTHNTATHTHHRHTHTALLQLLPVKTGLSLAQIDPLPTQTDATTTRTHKTHKPCAFFQEATALRSTRERRMEWPSNVVLDFECLLRVGRRVFCSRFQLRGVGGGMPLAFFRTLQGSSAPPLDDGVSATCLCMFHC